MNASHFILFVADQDASTHFYEKVLGFPPRLHVRGMSEFALTGGGILGLMPESGAARVLGSGVPNPASGNGIPRSELYLVVDDAARFHCRAIECGAKELSPFQPRDWGHMVGYSLDMDGHVLAFAQLATDIVR